jgi:hypothetical protein
MGVRTKSTPPIFQRVSSTASNEHRLKRKTSSFWLESKRSVSKEEAHFQIITSVTGFNEGRVYFFEATGEEASEWISTIKNTLKAKRSELAQQLTAVQRFRDKVRNFYLSSPSTTFFMSMIALNFVVGIVESETRPGLFSRRLNRTCSCCLIILMNTPDRHTFTRSRARAHTHTHTHMGRPRVQAKTGHRRAGLLFRYNIYNRTCAQPDFALEG